MGVATRMRTGGVASVLVMTFGLDVRPQPDSQRESEESPRWDIDAKADGPSLSEISLGRKGSAG